MPIRVPRVAFFTDSYYEANGVARTAAALERFAAGGDRPMLLVHGGRDNRTTHDGSIVRLELQRWRRTSYALEHDLDFDVALWRHVPAVVRMVREFSPDVVHVTGPSDIGLIGACVGKRLGLPIVGSWHTNLHEYASRRFLPYISWVKPAVRQQIGSWIERQALATTLSFYALPRVVLAPNREWANVLAARLRKPVFVMTRGVDTAVFSPAKRTRVDALIVNVGYVGRLSAEKNVRALAAVERALSDAGNRQVRFTIVGDGGERDWLREHMPHARFTGVLRGEALSEAYADMDLFVFPSETETVGNVVLEAMASGVPVVAMASGGPKYVAGSSQGATLARNEREFVGAALQLVGDVERRQAMAAAARRDALDRSWQGVFDTVYRAYGLAAALAGRLAARSEDAVSPVAERLSA
ncbi:MAG TPA: glycosyltransferase [Vicinamibacterales bacterium]|nr:glycosyltransferase [Vicinamibacterales bacterium]